MNSPAQILNITKLSAELLILYNAFALWTTAHNAKWSMISIADILGLQLFVTDQLGNIAGPNPFKNST